MELICYSRKISKLLKGWLRERFYPSKLHLLSFETKRDLDAKKKCLPDTRKKDKIFVYRVERSLMDSTCKQNI